MKSLIAQHPLRQFFKMSYKQKSRTKGQKFLHVALATLHGKRNTNLVNNIQKTKQKGV